MLGGGTQIIVCMTTSVSFYKVWCDMNKAFVFLFLTSLLSPLAVSSEVISSPVVYSDASGALSATNGFDIKIKSGDNDESLIGSILISDPSEIEKRSSSPIYSTKISLISTNDDVALFYIDFSSKGSRKVNDESFETYFFIRDVVEVNKTRGSRFNVGNNVIIFSPI